MPQQTIQLFRKGAECNLKDPFRKGNVVCLPDTGRVVLSGDLHGHTRNFERIVQYADLKNNPETHLVFQEIIHGGPEDDFGGCLSYHLLMAAIEQKIQFPGQVHILLGNHDTAVINNGQVLKSGREMNQAMKDAMKRQYGVQYKEVEHQLTEYLLTQPLAIRCRNRIWMSHSLPADAYLDNFDKGIFNRLYSVEDTRRPNSVYLLTWGRRHSQETLDRLALLLDVDLFILGHQPQDDGWSKAGANCIIIASEHNHGCLLDFDLSKQYTLDELTACIAPIASIG